MACGGLKGSLGQTPEKQKSEKLLSTYWPPKSCIPRSAKTTMNRKRRNNRLMMDFMELRRETTRFLRDAQYLPTEAGGGVGVRLGLVVAAEPTFPTCWRCPIPPGPNALPPPQRLTL